MLQEAEQKFSGLLNIYLYNSIFPGLLTQISCKGHTVNFGDNGAGKTTILNLLPIFYGLRPGRLISGKNNRLSFVDFYLPYTTSLIVFEYMKKGVVNNVLMFRHNENFRYCFIKADTEKQIFSEESLSALKNTNNAESWIKQYLQINQNCPISKMIDNSETYEAVLMNNRDVMSQRRDRHELYIAASKFALCNTGDEIRNLSSLTAVMLSDKSKMIDELKKMLVTCYVENQVSLNLPKSHQERSLLEELEAISELDKNIKNFSQAVELKKEISDYWGFIIECKEKLEKALNDCKTNQEIIQEQKDKKRSELDEAKKFYNKKIEGNETELSNAEHEKTSALNLIKRLEDAKEEWDKQNIVEKSEKYSHLDDYKEQWDRAKKYRSELEQDLNDQTAPIELKKSNRIKEITKEKADQYKKLTQELSENHNRILNIEEDFRNKEQSVKNNLQMQKDNLNKQYQERLNDINTKINNLTNQKVIDGKNTPEEIAAVETAERDYYKYSDNLNHNLKQQSEIQSEIITASSEISELQKELSALTIHHQRLVEEKSEALKQLNPPESSLIGFMEKHMPQWRESVGKVIRKDLLIKEGLKPYLTDEYMEDGGSVDGVYGLGLSLDEIEEPEYIQGRQELEDQISRITEEITAEEDLISRKKKSFSEKNDQLQKLNNSQSDLIREEKTLSENKILSENNVAEIKNKNLENISKRLKLLDQEISNCNISKDNLDDSLNKNLENIEETLKTRLLQCKGDCESKCEPFRSTEAMLQSRIDSLDEEYAHKIEDVEQNYKKELLNSKINYDLLKKAQDDSDTAKNNYTLVSSYKNLVDKYTNFMNGDYVQLDAHRNNLAKAQDNIKFYQNCINTDKQKIREIENNLKNEISFLKNQIDELNANIDKIDSFLKVNESFLNRDSDIPDYEPKQYVPEKLSIENMIFKCGEKLEAVAKKEGSLINNVKAVRNTMENQTGPHNRIAGYWKNIIESIKEKFGENYNLRNDSIRLYFALTDRIEEFISGDLKTIRTSVFNGLLSASLDYSNFYESLRHFNRVVNQVSGKFEQRISDNNPLESITDIKIALTSKIETFDIYTKLKSFNDYYREWEETNRNAGDVKEPSELLVKYFSYVSQALLNNEIESDINSLININISMKINGRLIIVRNDRDLSSGGSTGESKLAINVIFCGLTRMLCQDPDIKIHWPIDEIGEIYNDNLHKIFDMTERYGIYLFCAQPNLSYDKVQMFRSKNCISKTEGVKRCVEGFEEVPDNPLIKALSAGGEA